MTESELKKISNLMRLTKTETDTLYFGFANFNPTAKNFETAKKRGKYWRLHVTHLLEAKDTNGTAYTYVQLQKGNLILRMTNRIDGRLG